MGLALLRKGSHDKEIKISFTMNSKTCVAAGARSRRKLSENCKRKIIIKKIPYTERKFKNHKAILNAFLKGALY